MLDEGSGGLYSIRLFIGLFLWYAGILTLTERFALPQAMLVGASKPGTSRLYDCIVGLVMAQSALAC